MSPGNRGGGEYPELLPKLLSKIFSFQKGIMRHAKKQTKNMTQTLGGKTAYESDQTSDLTGKYFKVVIVNLFAELKESMIKEIKRCIMIMLHQIKNININTEIEIIKINTITKWKL